MVRAKEERNNQLQEELAKKQAEADGIAADVETQVDRMMQTLRGSVDDLEQRIQQQVADNQENAAVQTQAVKDTLEDMTSGLDAIKGELSEKVHSENVQQYRNIQDLLKELDNREETAKEERGGVLCCQEAHYFSDSCFYRQCRCSCDTDLGNFWHYLISYIVSVF